MTKRKSYNTGKNHSGGGGQVDYTEHYKVRDRQRKYKGSPYAAIFIVVLFAFLYLIKVLMGN